MPTNFKYNDTITVYSPEYVTTYKEQVTVTPHSYNVGLYTDGSLPVVYSGKFHDITNYYELLSDDNDVGLLSNLANTQKIIPTNYIIKLNYPLPNGSNEPMYTNICNYWVKFSYQAYSSPADIFYVSDFGIAKSNGQYGITDDTFPSTGWSSYDYLHKTNQYFDPLLQTFAASSSPNRSSNLISGTIKSHYYMMQGTSAVNSHNFLDHYIESTLKGEYLEYVNTHWERKSKDLSTFLPGMDNIGSGVSILYRPQYGLYHSVLEPNGWDFVNSTTLDITKKYFLGFHISSRALGLGSLQITSVRQSPTSVNDRVVTIHSSYAMTVKVKYCSHKISDQLSVSEWEPDNYIYLSPNGTADITIYDNPGYADNRIALCVDINYQREEPKSMEPLFVSYYAYARRYCYCPETVSSDPPDYKKGSVYKTESSGPFPGIV